MKLVDEIEEGTIEDSEDELLGIVLKALYSETWSVKLRFGDSWERRKWNPRQASIVNFGLRTFPRNLHRIRLVTLLDLVATRFEEYRSFMTGEVSGYTRMGVLPLELLVEVLRASWEPIPVERMLPWLKVVSELRQSAPQSLTSSIAFGLRRNPDKLKELIAHAVETCLADHDAWQCAALVKRWLFGARPYDYGPWCLGRALGAADAKAAAFYLGELLECVFHGRNSGGLTVERVRVRLAGNAALLELLDERMGRVDESASQGGGAHGRGPAADTTDQISWQETITAQAHELRAGRGDPRLLNPIAKVYLGVDKDVEGSAPSERLANLVGSRSDPSHGIAGGFGKGGRSCRPSGLQQGGAVVRQGQD